MNDTQENVLLKQKTVNRVQCSCGVCDLMCNFEMILYQIAGRFTD